ncbi:MAG TPA: DUF4435 domain-containing protein [Solirubrobacterales bacterium]|nr:DUF4435 domain-containing protein [Solirubrobacterales bacterium]
MPNAPRLRNLDPVDDLLARLRLDRVARGRGVAITEGPTDSRMLSAALGAHGNNFFSAGGRGNVLRCAEELRNEPLSGVICVADRDFDSGEDHWPGAWWLVFYDDADIEAMLVESQALTRVLDEWASEGKLARFGGVEAVRRQARESTGPLAVLRAINARDGLGIPFDGIEMQDLFDKKSGELRTASLIGKVAGLSKVSHAELQEMLDGAPLICPQTNRPLSRGRDLLAAISALLRRSIGSLSKQQTAGGLVEKSLRLAIRPGDLDGTPFRDRYDAAMGQATGG